MSARYMPGDTRGRLDPASLDPAYSYCVMPDGVYAHDFESYSTLYDASGQVITNFSQHDTATHGAVYCCVKNCVRCLGTFVTYNSGWPTRLMWKTVWKTDQTVVGIGGGWHRVTDTSVQCRSRYSIEEEP